MKTKRVLTFALGLVLLLASSACTRNDVGTPSPVGPSSFAVLLKLSASRNVIYAGDQRDGSTISVSLKLFDGTPLAGRTVYFEICDSTHLRVDVGYFEGMERVISRQTDGGGNITFVYNGPLNSEIEANTSVYIWPRRPRKAMNSSKISPRSISSGILRLPVSWRSPPTPTSSTQARSASGNGRRSRSPS